MLFFFFFAAIVDSCHELSLVNQLEVRRFPEQWIVWVDLLHARPRPPGFKRDNFHCTTPKSTLSVCVWGGGGGVGVVGRGLQLLVTLVPGSGNREGVFVGALQSVCVCEGGWEEGEENRCFIIILLIWSEVALLRGGVLGSACGLSVWPRLDVSA